MHPIKPFFVLRQGSSSSFRNVGSGQQMSDDEYNALFIIIVNEFTEGDDAEKLLDTLDRMYSHASN